MRARVQILRDTGEFPVSDHVLKIDGDYVFPVEGGIVDEETRYHLLGFEITGMWSTRREPKPLPASLPSSNLPLTESLFAELLTKLPVLTSGQNDITRAVNNLTHSIDELITLFRDRLPKV